MNRIGCFLRDMLLIRRIEYRIAEIPIVAIPVLLMNPDMAAFKALPLWEGVLIFFLLFAFGDMINCLADRDLDAIYKPHLSKAVYNLGVPFVTFQVVLTAVAALLVAAHLAWTLQRWHLLTLVASGIVLGAAYSVEPVRLKGRGLWQIACLWSIIFFGPMVFIASLFDVVPSIPVTIFAAAYGLMQMGIILVNTAEDYPEDRDAKIRTSIVSLGLHRGIALANALFLAGGLGVAVTLLVLFWPQRATLYCGALIPALAAYAFVARRIWQLHRSITGQELETSIAAVKRSAKNVPIWVTAVAWSSCGAVLALFLARHVA